MSKVYLELVKTLVSTTADESEKLNFPEEAVTNDEIMEFIEDTRIRSNLALEYIEKMEK